MATTYRLKAFGAFPPLINNTKDQVNPIGELSTYGETYASDRGIFRISAAPNSTLITFRSVNEISTTEFQDVPVPNAVSAQVLQIQEWLYGKSIAGLIVNDRQSLITALSNQFAGLIQQVDCGDMVKDANYWLPSWISFAGTSTTAPYTVRLWMADSYFRNQYDDYEIRPFAGIDNIDGFFNTATAVQAIVDSITVRDMASRAQEVANNQPFTAFDVEEFEWVDPQNKDRKIVVPFGFVIYGEAGINLDAKKQALIKWILENSTHTEDEWATIFPDIFGATEYIWVPLWPHYAIPGDQINGGVWSPVNNPKWLYDVAGKFFNGVGYDQEYIQDNMNVAGTAYKCVQAIVIGGPKNRDDIHQLQERWPDYLSVGTAGIDFARMSELTAEMVTVLMNMFKIAETMTSTSDMPHGYLRVIRNDVLYVAATVERTQLLVAARASLEAEYEPFTGSYKPPM